MEGYGYFVPLSDAKPPGNQSVIYDHRNYLDYLPKNENAPTFLQAVLPLASSLLGHENLGKPLDSSCLMPVWYGHYNDSLNNEINMTFKYAPDDLNSFVAQVS